MKLLEFVPPKKDNEIDPSEVIAALESLIQQFRDGEALSISYAMALTGDRVLVNCLSADDPPISRSLGHIEYLKEWLIHRYIRPSLD